MSESKDMLLIKELEQSGVFKGADGLSKLADADAFWEGQPYGTRLYFGDGVSEYLHRDVLRAALRSLAELSRLRAERDEAMHLLRAAKDGQIENNGLWHTMIHVEEFLSKHSKEGLPDKK